METKRKPVDVRRSVMGKSILSRLVSLEAEKERLMVAKGELYGSQRVACPNCGKHHEIRKMFLVRGMRYSRSYSSYEDSSWDPSDEFYSVCPSCAGVMQFQKGEWTNEFGPYFMSPSKGYLEFRRGLYEDGIRRDGRFSIIVSRRAFGYEEVLATKEQLSKAVDGVIPDVRYP